MNLCERKDTVVCLYDNESPRISAYDIHEWIHMKLRLEPDEISTIPVDGPKWQVYIKLTQAQTLEDLLRRMNGMVTYEHVTLRSRESAYAL
jgi:hypothetical protein